MNKPLEIRDVENITLEASDDNSDMYPQLVAQFSCHHVANSDCIRLVFEHFVLKRNLYPCCSVVWMINVTHAAIKGISVTVRAPTISGVILQQCSHLHIQSISYSSNQERENDRQDFVKIACGNLAYESSDIEMVSLEASNFTHGVWLHKSRNISMTNVSAAHNGIFLHYSTDTSMMSHECICSTQWTLWNRAGLLY